ncbi:hypothetical protein Q3A86_36365 [Streptomyces sp. NBUA17]|uniref:hypothetical protein n=1 Tax=Streptomyces sp. NBUA17 TaxID=3062275 RepID=UPI0037D9EC03
MDELVEHRAPPENPVGPSGRTPLEAWQADPTPVTDLAAADLWAYTLEDEGRPRKLTSHGVSWRGRTYTAAWMTGRPPGPRAPPAAPRPRPRDRGL